jgi:hypothetical protein
MKKLRVLRYVVPLAALALLAPWVKENPRTFESRAFLVLGLVFALQLGIRAWLSWLERQPRNAETSAPPARGIQVGSTTVSGWGILGSACALALLFQTASAMVVTNDTMSPFISFLLGTLGQQSVFAGAAIVVAQRTGNTLKPVTRAATLVAIMAMAIVFARASNITYEAHRPSLVPRFSDTTNMLFALPALVVGAAGILGLVWKR